MRIERQRALAARLLALHAAESTDLAPAVVRHPVTDYTGRDRFERERDVLFRRRPIVACASADVRDAGDVATAESGGVPLVITRDADGGLHAFANICRHRASILVREPAGHGVKNLQCGFHGWTYGLDGRLIGQPHSCGGFADLDRGSLGLLERPVAERAGLVFVRPVGDEPIDLDELLCGVDEEIAEFELDGYHRYDSWISTWRCNWKLIIDTFLEPYHVPALHRTTVARYYLVNPSLVDTFGPNLRYHSLQRNFTELASMPEHEWELASRGTIEYLVAPNTVLSHSVDHLGLYRFWPLAPDETRVDLTIYTPQPVDTDEARAHFARTLELHQKVSGGEDFAEQERIQFAMSSGVVDETIFGRNEPGVIRFHAALDELLAER